MKVAISLPDDLSARADQYARQHRLNRSALIAEALQEYLCKHRNDNLTEQINAAVEAVDQPSDAVQLQYNKKMLRNVEW